MIYIHPKAEPFFLKGSSDAAILLLHGFTASPSEVYPLAEIIHTESSCTVSGILLPGHGSSPKLLNRSSWMDWYKAVEIELNYLLANYERVYVGGLSMGGLLAIYAGLKHEAVQGVIAINAPIYMKHSLLMGCAPLIKYFKPYFPKTMDNAMKELEKQGRFAYRVMPIQAFQSLLKLRREVMRKVQKLNKPVLVIQSLQDESVQARSGRFLLQKTGACKSNLLELKNSGHIASMGPEKTSIAQEIIGFINLN